MRQRILHGWIVLALIYVGISGTLYGQTPKPQYNVLEKMKQTATINKPVVVRFLHRPLAADKLGVLPGMTEGVATHVQIVAYDKETNQIIDNFGLTGEFDHIAPAEIVIEDPAFIQDKYYSTPLGVVEMSSEVYYEVRDRTICQMSGAYYTPLNSVNLAGNVKIGAVIGTVLGFGSIVGGGSSAAYSVSEYRRNGRHNYYHVKEDASQTSHPGLNCQAMVNAFLKNGEGKPTWKVVMEYRQPGEKPAKPYSEQHKQAEPSQVTLSTINLEDNNYDWCTCDSPGCVETDIMVSFQCSKCKKINRKYAKKALELEHRLKEKGEEVKWFGDGAESKARKAAGTK